MDRGGIEPGLEVHIFFDHFYTGGSSWRSGRCRHPRLGAGTDVCMPQPVGRPGTAFAAEAEIFLIGLEARAGTSEK
jgi:hypothetical protein